MRSKAAVYFPVLATVMLLSVFLYHSIIQARGQEDINNTTAMQKDVVTTQNDVVWGNQVNGIAIAAIAQKSRYALNNDMLLTVSVKNFKNETVTIQRSASQNYFYEDYRIALYTADGTPVEKSEMYATLEEEAYKTPQHPVINAKAVLEIAPGETSSSVFKLNDWFVVDKAGDYSLVIMRRLWGWNAGVAISNLAAIHVVKDGGEVANP